MAVAEIPPVQDVSPAPEQDAAGSQPSEERMAPEAIEEAGDQLFIAGVSEEVDDITGSAAGIEFAENEDAELSVDQAETAIAAVPEVVTPGQEIELQDVESSTIPLDRTDQPHQTNERLLNPLTEESEADRLFESEEELKLAESTENDSTSIRPQLHEFQFGCSICHSLIAASTLQIGELIKCVDCESSIRVPQPDPLSLRPVGTFFQTDVDGARLEEMELGISDAIELPKFDLPNIDLLGEDDSLLSAPRSTSGSTIAPPAAGKPLGSAASNADSDRKPAQSAVSKPTGQTCNADRLEIKSLGEFLAFVAHADFIFRWITLSMILTAELVLFRLTIGNFGSSDLATRMTGIPLAFPTLLMVFVYAVVSSVFGSNVLDQTAAGQRTIDQWPEFEFFGWLSRSFFYLTSFWLSSLPGLAISLAFLNFSFWYWLAVPLLAISFLIFFPVLLFSVLCNQQAWNPVSKPVWDSFKTCRASWQQFYVYSGIIIVAAAPLLLLQIWPNFFTSVILATAFSFLLFAYFRLLGYLGRALSKHLEISNPT